MFITYIELTNFKCHTSSSFTFGKVNHFFGDNYAGKSSIGEAIVFCLFGVTKHGHKTFVKDYLKEGKTSMRVQVKLLVNNEEYIIVRRMNSRGTTNVFIGNEKADEKEIKKLIGDFQSYTYCFFPDIFPEEEKNTARSFLIDKLIPNKKDLEEYEREKNNLLKQQKSVSSSITFYEGQRAVLKKQLEALPSNQNLDNTPPENILVKKKQLQDELFSIQKQMDELILEGANHKANLVSTKEKLQEIDSADQATKEYCPTCHQKLPESQLHSVGLINQEKKGKLHVEIQALEYKLEVEKREYQELSRQKDLLEAELKELNSRFPSHEKNDMAVQQLNEVENRLSEHKQKKNSLTQELKQIKHQMGELANTYQFQINQQLTDTRIMLFKQLKSGEFRPDFQITYKGRPYRVLSNSEKVRCMLEIIKIINKHANYPIFLDNLESITHLHAPDTQVITATVKKGMPLTLKIKE
jgi:chromosome segregation ATPase